MRNLTTQAVTDLTGHAIQLIDTVTGEMDAHANPSALAAELAAGLISTDAGNTLVEGTDGKLFVSAQVAIDDDQVLTGDNTTNTTVTLTPTTVADQSGGDQVNYTIKAEVKIDGVTIVEDPVTKELSVAFPDAFKELHQFHVDGNGNDTTGTGADEAPYRTVQAAVNATTASGVTVVADGSYPETVTMSLANTSLRGEGNEYGVLTTITNLNVTTASGTSNRVASILVSGNVTHSGGAPLYLTEMTISGDFVSTSTAYEEIRHSRIQDGTISKTTTGTLNIVDSFIGTSTFSTAGSVIALRNVDIDPGKTVTIGAGVVYLLDDVRGNVVIDPAAIPAATAALSGGLTGDLAKDTEVASFNDIRLTNVPTITTATKALVRDARGVVSEQEFPSGIPTGGTDGQVLTVQPDGSYAWETPAAGGSSANWMSATTNPTPAGNTGTLPRFQWNTVTGEKWYVDSNGIALSIESATTDCGNVYFDGTDPSTATIFDTVNPPVTNNDALKNQDCAIYIGEDGSVWTSDGTTYSTKVYSFPLQQLDPDTIATAGQTAFTLLKTPIGKVYIYRNGVRLSAAAISWVGTAVTYLPAGNGGKTMDAGDRVEFEYEAY